jgi:hypothetical protein
MNSVDYPSLAINIIDVHSGHYKRILLQFQKLQSLIVLGDNRMFELANEFIQFNIREQKLKRNSVVVFLDT